MGPVSIRVNPDEVLRRWAERSGEYSPAYYAHYGPNETSELIRGRLDAAVDRSAAVLELGCSSGRHLAHLHDHGYGNLHGIDVNDEAFAVMGETYPGLTADGTFYREAIENTVDGFDSGRFDAVYSVETLQHLHPDNAWVFEELTRITDGLLITVENEGGDEAGHYPSDRDAVNYVHDEFPLYYRDWNRVFTELGLVEIRSESTRRDTLRVFRSARN